MNQDRIIEKIQKLLQLANSDNENEAKSATNRANELLLKYNLNLQQINDYQTEYGTKDVASTGLTLKPYQKMIAQLLQEFFFVRILISKKFVGYSSGRWASRNAARSQYQKVIQLVGTKENCQIAGYIFDYLNQAYPKLWEEYYSRNARVDHKDKTSYFTGLTRGIANMLDETKWKVENETGLVLKKDPKLDEFINTMAKGTYGGQSRSDLNRSVVADGIKDGMKVTLRKPIHGESFGESGKFLQGSKKET